MSDHRGADDRWGGGKGDNQVGECGGYSQTRVLRQGHCRGSGLTGGSPDTKSGRGILRHRPRGGGL